ncbi:unnamed protein product, partial [Amoebophrya sp. A25]
GFLVRSLGIAKSCLLFGSSVMIGSFLQIYAVANRIYLLAVVGRVLFWAGISTTGIVQVVLCFLLFSNKYAAIAQAGVLAACRIGATVGYILSDKLKHMYRVEPDDDPSNACAFLSALKLSYVFVSVSGCCYLFFAYLYAG